MDLSFNHAIVALDLSEASDLIVDSIPNLKKFGTEKVTLVTVVPVPHSVKRKEFSTDSQRQTLKAYKKKLEEAGFDVYFEIKSGVHFYPPTEILSAADEHNAGYVVIANRGESKVQELVLGSTASEVLQRSHLPIHLINIEVDWPDPQDDRDNRKLVLSQPAESTLDHVLHATDFSDTADRAFNVIRNLEADGKVGKVSIVHVQGHHYLALSDPASLEDLTNKNRDHLNEMRNQLSDHTRESCETIVTFGTPAKEIVTAAEENGATMIIMGSQGKGYIEKFFIGGVSTQVTRIGKIPMLLIPALRDEDK